MTNDRLVRFPTRPYLSFVICHQATSLRRARLYRLVMKTWIAIFLASVWVHSALAAAALQVTYLDKTVAVDASDAVRGFVSLLKKALSGIAASPIKRQPI